MKSFQDLKKHEITSICDYLRRPSKSATEDLQRRKVLYEFDIVKQTKTNQSNGKYLSGPLGEAIIRLYFEKQNQVYIPHPSQVVYDDEVEGRVIIRPDGKLNLIAEAKLRLWVEGKMRAYCSTGTANAKIHGVPEKYCHIGKLMLFLLADDEHMYNRRWYKLRRQEIPPANKCEEYHMLGDLEVLHSIVLGTEVADVLQS
jgi:hypothetical protein